MAACFSSAGLRLRMADPTEPREDAVPIDASLSELARVYYAPLFDVANALGAEPPPSRLSLEMIELPGMDVAFEVATDVVRWYTVHDLEWSAVMDHRAESAATLSRFDQAMLQEGKAQLTDTKPVDDQDAAVSQGNVFRGADGVTIHLGPSWSDELMEREPERRADE